MMENTPSRSTISVFQDFPFTKGNLQDCVHHGDSYGVSHSLALEGVVCVFFKLHNHLEFLTVRFDL